MSGPRAGRREWIGLALLALPTLLLPEYRDTQADRLDLTSAALSLAAILPVICGLKELAKDGIETLPMLAIVAGAGFGMLFAFRQRRLTSPLLDLRLFGTRTFSVALGIMLLGTVTMGGIFLFVTLYLRMVEGLSPLQAGLWLVPSALAVVADTMLAPAIARLKSS